MTKEALLKDILKDTNGELVYSEQISLILHKALGLSVKETNALHECFNVHSYFHRRGVDIGLDKVLSWDEFQSKLKEISEGNLFVENFLVKTFSLDRKRNLRSRFLHSMEDLSPIQIINLFMYLADGKFESAEEIEFMLSSIMPDSHMELIKTYSNKNERDAVTEMLRLVSKSTLSISIKKKAEEVIYNSLHALSNRDFTLFSMNAYEKLKDKVTIDLIIQSKEVSEDEITVSDRDGMVFEVMIPYEILEGYQESLGIKIKKDGKMERRDKDILVGYLKNKKLLPEGPIFGSISTIHLEDKIKLSVMIFTVDKCNQLMEEMHLPS